MGFAMEYLWNFTLPHLKAEESEEYRVIYTEHKLNQGRELN